MSVIYASKRKPKPLRAKTKVWVVIHCEYFQFHDCTSPTVDEMAFHVSSTLSKAERYMRGCNMSSYSWWKVQQFGVNENNDEGQVHYYTHKGLPIESPPFK